MLVEATESELEQAGRPTGKQAEVTAFKLHFSFPSGLQVEMYAKSLRQYSMTEHGGSLLERIVTNKSI